jgi:signal transduction histidine kinase
MRFFRRSLIALGVAAILPIVLFSAVQVFSLLQDQKHRIEAATIVRAQEVMALTDSEIDANFSVLDILATSQWIEDRNFEQFYKRMQRARAEKKQWASIMLYDVKSGQEIFDLREPFGAPQAGPVEGSPARLEASALGVDSRHIIGGIELNPASPLESCVWLHRVVLYDGVPTYVISLALKPQVFQELLVSRVGPDVVAGTVDRDGRFIARTVNFEKRVGQAATSYVTRTLKGTEPQGIYRARTYEGFENYTAFYRSPVSGWSVHIAVAAPLIDGPQSWSLLVALLAGLGGLALATSLVVLVLRDMAERRRAEEALRQSQKMEAIGQLTGGIAHDFNNLLTAIIGNLDLIRMRSKAEPGIQQLAQSALEASRRGAKLSSQLLAFSRSQRMSIGPVNLEKLLSGMQGLIAQSIGPNISLSVDVQPLARYVLSETNQLELAFLNLAVNARDAMPKGGTFTIAARVAQSSETTHLPSGDYIAIDVTDTGIGMNEETRARALEPFFTTKPVGQGTGLGLSQVFGVVRESGGSVRIESELGNGTTIHLLLRTVPSDVQERDITRPSSGPVQTNHTSDRVILVVDDDRQVRRFVSSSLQTLGYETYEAANGAAALEMLDTLRPTLLISDFAMPGMNGAELASRAQRRLPGLRILIMSGYADSAAIDTAVGATRILRKPFDVSELSTAVADVFV